MEPLVLTADDVADGESWEDVVLTDTLLPGIDARALGFSDSEFDGTDLSGAKLQNLFLVDCCLRRANLANAVVRNGSMRRVEFAGCRLTGFTWTGGEAREAEFKDCRADIASFEFAKLQRCVFEDCDLRDADFRSARLEHLRFVRCDLTGADFNSARFAAGCSMSGCTLDGLRGVDRLRGLAMPWNDILAAAPIFAAEIGVRVLDEDEPAS